MDLQDMERRTSTRLSVVERNQNETNMRLDNIQSMIQSVLSTINSSGAGGGGGDIEFRRNATPSVGETIGTKADTDEVNEVVQGGVGCTEEWWDKLTKSSDEEVDEIFTQVSD